MTPSTGILGRYVGNWKSCAKFQLMMDTGAPRPTVVPHAAILRSLVRASRERVACICFVCAGTDAGRSGGDLSRVGQQPPGVMFVPPVSHSRSRSSSLGLLLSLFPSVSLSLFVSLCLSFCVCVCACVSFVSVRLFCVCEYVCGQRASLLRFLFRLFVCFS